MNVWKRKEGPYSIVVSAKFEMNIGSDYAGGI